MTSRREFLAKSIWTGAAMAAAGCISNGKNLFGQTAGAPMHGYVAPKLDVVRLAIVGLGGRGSWAFKRISGIPGVKIVAACDLYEDRVDKCNANLAAQGREAARKFVGPEAYKRVCALDDVDVVYVTTSWDMHAPVALEAMRNGKHTFIEVPSVFTLDDCWELVETSEKTKRNCMQLENCCYGEIEMLTFNLARLGMFGELVHAEGAYIHDLRNMCSHRGAEYEGWRYGFNRDHQGNMYPTHGLVPLCLTFDINRGDRFDYLVSLESQQANFEYYKKNVLKPGDPRLNEKVAMGDMNTTLIKTAKGKSIMVQHDVSTPRPYSRIQFVSGTKGAIGDYPYRVVFEEKCGAGAHNWFAEKKAAEIREKYKHPLWKTRDELVKRKVNVAGHGGMDFLMDLRWVYCLRNGLPLDMDVYDLAATCSLCELCEKSVKSKSRSMDVPDFTRGAWRTAKPLDLVDVDLKKAGLI